MPGKMLQESIDRYVRETGGNRAQVERAVEDTLARRRKRRAKVEEFRRTQSANPGPNPYQR